ncbi:hypothetical protein JW796_02540 [Candidatus Dojkabacteria bacterium]|nr:hypothetical protein [Candidatus Dojkabacteria bacterium]
MSLKRILKNKTFVRITLVFLMLTSAALVYFFGFNLSKEFSSSTVVEYYLSGFEAEKVEEIISKVKRPVYVERTEDGRVLFYFKNISSEDIEKIDEQVGDENKESLGRMIYQVEPVIDHDLEYRYLNIFLIGLVGAAVLIVYRFRGGLKALHLAAIYFIFQLSFIFELVLSLGFISLAGLVGMRLDLTALYALLFLFVISFFAKYVILAGIHKKAKERINPFLSMWLDELKIMKKLFISAIILISSAFVLFFIFVPDFRFALVISEVSLFIFGLSIFVLIPEILDLRWRKNGNT